MSIVEDTERTRFCPQTDRRTDGQTDKVIPVYPPINFVEAGGIINQSGTCRWKERNEVIFYSSSTQLMYKFLHENFSPGFLYSTARLAFNVSSNSCKNVTCQLINSLWPDDAISCLTSFSTDVVLTLSINLVMTCHLFGTKSLPELMLTHCALNPKEQTFYLPYLRNFNQSTATFLQENQFEILSAKCQPFCFSHN